MVFKQNNHPDTLWNEIINITESDNKSVLLIQYIDYITKHIYIFDYYPTDTESIFLINSKILKNSKAIYREFLIEKNLKKVDSCSSFTECKEKSFFDLKEIMEILDSDKLAEHKLDDLKDYFTN